MAYCRFSCDNSKSDVYVWHDVGGYWAVAVAELKFQRKNGKLVFENPKPPGLPHDGKLFKCRTLETTILKLKMLKRAGYHVPLHAFQRLEREIISQKQVDKKRK